MIIKCKYCNNDFKSRHGRIFCSQECRKSYLDRQKQETYNKKNKICIICGKEFHGRGKTCSNFCSGKLGIKSFQLNNKEGLSNPAQRKEVKEKIKETFELKYGGHPFKTKEVIEKFKETYNNKSNEEKEKILNKRRKTFIEHFGVDNPLKSKEIQDKVKQTNLEKYGDENPFRTENFKKKASQTWLEKYGVEQIAQSKEKNIRTKQTKLERYGNANYVNIEKIKQTCQERYGVDNPLQSKEIQEKAQRTNVERYGVPYNCMTEQCREASPVAISKINKEFERFLNDNGYETELEFTIGRFSYDIHILNTNILIEIDPAYTHNSTVGPQYNKIQLEPRDKYYHYNKTKLALENDYICIHKFNWITKDQILKMIKKIKETNIKQEEPRLHYYNMKTRKHIKNTVDNKLLEQGFVEIYDDGIILK